MSCNIIYVDAGFNPKTKEGIVGISDEFLLETATIKKRFKDNNEAELFAVLRASDMYPTSVEIHTDSQYAIDNYNGSHVVKKCNRENVANILVRSHKEDLRK